MRMRLAATPASTRDVGQFFNRVEKRLARILMLMVEYSHPEDWDL
jgi:hypothetical protein